MQILYLRDAENESEETEQFVSNLADCGLELRLTTTVAELERELADPSTMAWLHIAEWSSESETEVIARAEKWPWKLTIVAARSSSTIHKVIVAAGSSQTDGLIAIIGFDKPVAEIARAVATRFVRAMLAESRQMVCPEVDTLSAGGREAVESLFSRRPFVDGAERGRSRDNFAGERELAKHLRKRRFKPQAQIRKAHFAMFFHLCVCQLGMGVEDALRPCGLRDRRAAEKKLNDVFGSRDIQAAALISGAQALRLALHFMCVDRSAFTEVRPFDSHAAICDWLRGLQRSQKQKRGGVSTRVDEEAAWRGVIARNERMVRAMCAKLIPAGADMQDAQQEVWMRAVNALRVDQEWCSRVSASSGNDEDLSWERHRIAGVALGVLRNFARTLRRTIEREHYLDAETDHELYADQTSLNALELLERAEGRMPLLRAIQALSREQCDMIVLKFYEGLTAREIAARRDISESTVSRQLAAALKVLGSVLSGNGGLKEL